MLVYEITYETLDHKHPVIITEADKVKYIPTKKYREFDRNYLLNLSSNHPETLLEAHERFHPEKYSINQDMDRLDVEYNSRSNLLDQ